MVYDEKNGTGTDDLTEADAVTLAEMQIVQKNNKTVTSLVRDFDTDGTITEFNLNLSDLADAKIYKDVVNNDFIGLLVKSGFTVAFPFDTSNIKEGIVELDSLNILTGEQVHKIANDSQNFKRLNGDSPDMPKFTRVVVLQHPIDTKSFDES